MRRRDHLKPPVTRLVCALVSMLAGCGSGCDGEHRRVHAAAQPPRVADAVVVTDAGTAAVAEPAAAAPPTLTTRPGFLAAPRGSLDGLFTGLAAAGRGDPTARVLWLFFGDSHTAGDSLTSRLRGPPQSKSGAAGPR